MSETTTKSVPAGEGKRFKVRRRPCSTCIYGRNTPVRQSVEALEKEVTDRYGSIEGYRVCHHTDDACCKGFWDRHKKDFALGRLALGYGLVEYVDDDILDDLGIEATPARLQQNGEH